MTDDVVVVHEALRARGWGAVTSALGIRWQRGQPIPCVLHGGKKPKLSFDEKGGKLSWICSSRCGAGDVIDFIEKLHGVGFRDALEVAAGIAGVDLRAGSDLTDEQRTARDREHQAYREAAEARQREEAERDAKTYPPADEIAAVWAAGAPVTSDSEVAEYLDCRAIPARQVAALGLLRVVQSGALPRWAQYRGRSWLEIGHRILVQTFDHTGQSRSLRSWRVAGDEDTPKRLPPAGYLSKGLVCANAVAVMMLREQFPGRLVVCEGESDWAVWACRGTVACIGITSGSWTQDFADRLAYGTELVIRTDRDEAGEKYAQHIAKTAAKRCEIWRAA